MYVKMLRHLSMAMNSEETVGTIRECFRPRPRLCHITCVYVIMLFNFIWIMVMVMNLHDCTGHFQTSGRSCRNFLL
jgi:hypothetical protein